VRVVLAEDSVLLREGLARLLGELGFDVVARCETGDELLEAVGARSPDVAIVDIRLPPTHSDEGMRAAREIRARHPSVGVLLLSQYVEAGLASELLSESAEGLGYLLKERVRDVGDFAGAVRRVGSGGSALDPAIVRELLGGRKNDDRLAALTPREREVLALMAEGRSNQGIAERLGISERAVQKHIASLCERLGVATGAEDHRRVLAVLAFLRG
jgi:DNA-binding NarL/FixJ family response regulator